MLKSLYLLLTFCFIMGVAFSQADNDIIHFETHDKTIYGMCFSNNGEELGVADGSSIKMFSVNNQELLFELEEGHKKQILSFDISRNNNWMVSGGKDSTIVLWDLINRKMIRSLKHHNGMVTAVQFTPDSKYLVSGGTDNIVFIYCTKEDKIIHSFSDHKDDVTSIDICPNGRLLATAGGDKSIYIYDMNNYRMLTTLSGHKNWVRDVSFNNDGTRLFSCGDDSRIFTWKIDGNEFKILQESRYFSGWLLSIDSRNKENSYVYGGINGKVVIHGPFGYYKWKSNSPVHKVCFNPNYDRFIEIAISTRGKGVILMNAQNMKFVDRQ